MTEAQLAAIEARMQAARVDTHEWVEYMGPALQDGGAWDDLTALVAEVRRLRGETRAAGEGD